MNTNFVSDVEGSPNGRWVIAGPFTPIQDRDELFQDLEEAVKEEAAPSVLVVFGFERLKHRLLAMLEPDANVLLGRIAQCLVQSSETAGVLYESRRGEFCGLFPGDAKRLDSALTKIRDAIDRELESLGIHAATGVASLPTEAGDPIVALELADRRCREVAGDLRPDRRRSIYTRIVAALNVSMSDDHSIDEI